MTSREPRALPNRREFVALGLGAFVLAAVPFARRDRRRAIRRTMPVMATTADFTVVHADPQFAERAIDAAMAELTRVERLMSRFQSSSDIGRANATAAHAPVIVTAETYAVLEAGLRWARGSNGGFDPAIGRVVELWDVAHQHEPPPAPRVRALAARHFYRHLELGQERGKPAVAFASPDIHLDLGGIACGYGIDLAVDALRRWGIQDALINVSGDIYALGSSPEGAPWRVGIQSPNDRDRLIGEVEITNQALATSGDYEQFFMYRGRRYHHLMDPEIAAPRQTPLHSATVIAERCIDADAGSTTVFGMSPAEARRVLSVCAPGARLVSAA